MTAKCFWAKWEHWRILSKLHISRVKSGLTVFGNPSVVWIPHFLTWCAVTRELFDVIIELRPSLTSGGLVPLHLFVSSVILILM